MAIHSLLEQETVSPGALLFCDNQAAVATIGTGPSCDPDVAKIQRLAVEVQAALVWVPGHEGVPGNERADALAQGAADSGGRLVANKSEPAVLRRKIKEMTYAVWLQRWSASPKCYGHRPTRSVALTRPKTASASWLPSN